MKYLSFAMRFFIMFIITFILSAFIISLLPGEKMCSSDVVAIILVTPIIAIILCYTYLLLSLFHITPYLIRLKKGDIATEQLMNRLDNNLLSISM